jgi:hypothetical protein
VHHTYTGGASSVEKLAKSSNEITGVGGKSG